MTMTTAVEELPPGRHLRENIYRHYAPDVEDLQPKRGEVVFHTMVTSVAEWAAIKGELIRWITDDGEVGYEVRIDGLDEHGGICDVAAHSINSIAGIAKVANDLRYEWEIITGVYPDRVWSV
jgi:hypothetical protein